MKFWNIPNPSTVYKSFFFFWPLLFKVDILCPPDVWKTSCCIEVLTLCLAVGAAAQVDHKRHTWSAVWNSCFFSVVILSLRPDSKELGRRRRRKREEKMRERRGIWADSSYQVMERADGLKGIKEIKVFTWWVLRRLKENSSEEFISWQYFICTCGCG